MPDVARTDEANRAVQRSCIGHAVKLAG
jgi:hypothetical protein